MSRSLLVFFLCALPCSAQVWHDLHSGETLAWTRLPASLAQWDVVCVGESHPDAAHHRVQLEVIKALHGEGPVGIGLEMLWREQQPIVDRYLQGELDEPGFLEAVAWQTTWGYDWELYAPIFRYAKQNGLALFGLNARRDLVRSVGRKGLGGLSLAERLELPEIDLELPGHRELFLENLGGAHGAHGGEGFERMYQAMTLWDEFMAESAARFCRTTPGARLVVIAGSGHIEGRLGIPARIERRLGAPVGVVLPRAVDSGAEAAGTEEADILVATRPFGVEASQPAPGLEVVVWQGRWYVETPGHLAAWGLHTDDVIEQVDARSVAGLATLSASVQRLTVERAGRRLVLRPGGFR